MPWKFTWPQSWTRVKQYSHTATQPPTHKHELAALPHCNFLSSLQNFATRLLQHWVWHITLARGKLDRENLKCSRKCLQQSVLMQMFTASVLMQTFTAVCAHANFYCSLCSCKLLLQSVLMQMFTASVLMQTFTAVCAHANVYSSLNLCKPTCQLWGRSSVIHCQCEVWSL